VNIPKVIRAALGVLVVFILASVVYNWYGDFKTAAPKTPVAAKVVVGVVPPASVAATVTGVGIARIDGVNFRTRPAFNAKLIRGLKKNERVAVLAKEGQWYQVKDSKGKIGWVSASGDYVILQSK
jgi:hypothetical protein